MTEPDKPKRAPNLAPAHSAPGPQLEEWFLLPAKARLDALLERPDAARAVQSTPVTALYYSISEVGLADATDVVQLCSPEQFKGFVDLGGWRKDRVELSEVLTWVRAARGDEEAAFLAKVHGLDLELIELLLRHYAVVHDLEADPDAHPRGPTMETPEGKFLIEFLAEGVELEALRRLVGDLMGENPFEFSRFLESTRWDLPTELEEAAYHFRAARLSDLGFPSLEEALSLFARADVPQAPPSAPSTALAPDSAQVDYVGEAIAGLEPKERQNAQEELVQLANSVLVAEATDPGDIESVRRAGSMARDYLNLGFEHLTHGNPRQAAEVLRATPFRRLFQVGFSLTLRLKFRADKLAKEPLAQVADVPLLLDEEAAAVAALRRKRPLRALKVEGSEPVSFRSRRELAEAEALLDRAEGQLPVLRAALGGTELQIREAIARCADPLFPPTAQRLLGCGVAWGLLEGRVEVSALSVEQLSAVLAKVVGGSPEAPSLREGVAQAAAQVFAQEGIRPLIDRVLFQWVSQLGAAYLRRGSLMPTARAIVPMTNAA